jgi:hypothetical protein
MVGAPQGAMRVASQIWQVVLASQTLQVFCLALRKKAQYVVVRTSIQQHILYFILPNLYLDKNHMIIYCYNSCSYLWY